MDDDPPNEAESLSERNKRTIKMFKKADDHGEKLGLPSSIQKVWDASESQRNMFKNLESPTEQIRRVFAEANIFRNERFAQLVQSSTVGETMRLIGNSHQSQIAEAMKNANIDLGASMILMRSEYQKQIGDAIKNVHIGMGDTLEQLRLTRESQMAKAFSTARIDFGSIVRSMQQIQIPWLDTLNVGRSFSGMLELHVIGKALENIPPFNPRLTRALRSKLGDWRDPITWAQDAIVDSWQRTSEYVSRGLDPALTDFESEAFDAGLESAGLDTDLQIYSKFFGVPVEHREDVGFEAGVSRAKDAFEVLRRLEIALREFIHRVMTRQYGVDWERHRLPKELYDKWLEKRHQAIQAGCKADQLIDYADFTDYVRVVTKRDNWKEVFSAVFRREEDFRESLQRMYPVRIVTMHAREVTQEDVLLLLAEARRLTQSIFRYN